MKRILLVLLMGCGSKAGQGTAEQPEPQDAGADRDRDAALEAGEHVVSEWIDQSGGQLCLSDGLCLDVPPDALGETMAITLRDDPELAADAPADIVRSIELLPDGLVLNVPATLFLPIAAPSDPDSQELAIWLYGPNGWEEESVGQFDGDSTRAPISHFSVRVAQIRCGGAELEAWRIAETALGPDRDPYNCRTAYLLPCDSTDAPKYWGGPFSTPPVTADGYAVLHAMNSPETLGFCTRRYRPLMNDPAFRAGAILYHNRLFPSSVTAGSSGPFRARLYPYHVHYQHSDGVTPDYWNLGVALKAGNGSIEYALYGSSARDAVARCAGLSVAEAFLGNSIRLARRTDPRTAIGVRATLAPNQVALIDGWHEVFRARTQTSWLEVEVSGSGAADAKLLELAVPAPNIPLGSASLGTYVDGLLVQTAPATACFGQVTTETGLQPNQCSAPAGSATGPFRPVHQRGWFPSAERQATWTYDTRAGVSAMVLAQAQGDCPCGFAGRFGAASGDQEAGTDCTVGNGNGCTGWAGTAQACRDTIQQNRANFGVIYRVQLVLENPLEWTEQVDLALGFRTGEPAVVARVQHANDLDFDLLRVAPDHRACRGGVADCRNLSFLLATYTVPAAASGSGRLTKEIELTIAGGGAAPVWLMLLPRRLVSSAENAVRVVDTRGRFFDSQHVPTQNSEIQVRAYYPFAPITGGVRVLQEDQNGNLALDARGNEVAVPIRVYADIADSTRQTTKTCAPNDAECRRHRMCDGNQCQPVRKLRLLRIVPQVPLQAETRYRLEVRTPTASEPVGLRDLYANDLQKRSADGRVLMEQGQPVMEAIPAGASVDSLAIAVERARIHNPFYWRFRTGVNFSLSTDPVAGSSVQCQARTPTTSACDCCPDCPMAVRVNVLANPPLPETLTPQWSCTYNDGSGRACTIAGNLRTATVALEPLNTPFCIDQTAEATVRLQIGSTAQAETVARATCTHMAGPYDPSCF